MVKKIFSVLILLSAIIFASTTSAEIAKCPTYLDADKNYILFADLGGHGAGLYVDRHTCQIAAEIENGCIIIIDEVQVPDAAEGKTQIVNRYVHKYSFDVKKKIARRYVNETDEWIKLDPTVTNPEDENFTYDARIAEMAFYIATGKKFFGTFDANFYKILDAAIGNDAEKNYILLADLGAHGARLYVDKKSVNVIQSDAGGCIISVDEVQVPDANLSKTEIVNRINHTYSYVNDKKVVMCYVGEKGRRWAKINPAVTNPEDENFTYDATIAEIAYYLATGKKFFGTFNEDFYKNLK